MRKFRLHRLSGRPSNNWLGYMPRQGKRNICRISSRKRYYYALTSIRVHNVICTCAHIRTCPRLQRKTNGLDCKLELIQSVFHTDDPVDPKRIIHPRFLPRVFLAGKGSLQCSVSNFGCCLQVYHH